MATLQSENLTNHLTNNLTGNSFNQTNTLDQEYKKESSPSHQNKIQHNNHIVQDNLTTNEDKINLGVKDRKSKSRTPSPIRRTSPFKERISPPKETLTNQLSNNDLPQKVQSRSPSRERHLSPPHKSPIKTSPIKKHVDVADAKASPSKLEKSKKSTVKKNIFTEPVERKGKRERKSIERFAMPDKPVSTQKTLKIEKGKGKRLNECPQVEYGLQRAKPDILKVVHRLLFSKPGTKHIREFSGFPFSHESNEYKKRFDTLHKYNLPILYVYRIPIDTLKQICIIFDLPKSSHKEDLITRIMEFLMLPVEGAVPTSEKKKSAKKPVGPKKTTPKSTVKKSSAANTAGSTKKVSAKLEVTPVKTTPTTSSSKNTSGTKRKSNEKSGVGEGTPKKRLDFVDDDTTVSSAKKKRVVVVVKKDGTSKKVTTPKTKSSKTLTAASGKKTPKKGGKHVSSHASPKKSGGKEADKEIYTDTEEENHDSDTEKEEIIEPAKTNNTPNKSSPIKSPSKATNHTTDGKAPHVSVDFPTDDQIKAVIQKILDGANLMEITMKSVCKKVGDEFANFDLSSKKDFIKTTVKSLLA